MELTTEEKIREADLLHKQAEIKKTNDLTLIEKVGSLLDLLESREVKSNPIPGSEPMYEPIFNEDEKDLIREKIMDIVNKF